MIHPEILWWLKSLHVKISHELETIVRRDKINAVQRHSPAMHHAASLCKDLVKLSLLRMSENMAGNLKYDFVRWAFLYAVHGYKMTLCLSVVCLYRTQPVKIFCNVSTPFGTLAICWHLTSTENFTEIVPGEPLRQGLNARGAAT